MLHSQTAYQTEQLLEKKFSDSMPSSKSTEMTAVWPNDRETFTFFATSSNNVQNWTTFEKKVFWFDI